MQRQPPPSTRSRRLLRFSARVCSIWLAAVLAVAGTGVTPALANEPAAAPAVAPAAALLPPVEPADRFGVNESFAASALANGLGAGWTRWVIEWSSMQAKGPQDFNQFYVDEKVLARELGNGFRMAGLLKNTPEWAQRDPELGPRSVPLNLDEPVFVGDEVNPENFWAAFAFKMAAEYAGRIDVWMIWNEVEIPLSGPNFIYNTWAGTPAEYYRLLKVAYQAIKAANSGATLVLTPYSYHRDKQEAQGQRLPWFEAFQEAAMADPEGRANGFFFDVLALNLYRNAHDLWDRMHGACSLQDNESACLAATVPDDNYATDKADRKGFARRLAEMGAPGKPIWLTELNAMPYDDTEAWNAAAKNDGFRITMDEQASWVIQAYAVALAAGYERIFWQAMTDDPPPTTDELWGLTRYHSDTMNEDESRLRPAYVAYQVAAKWLGNADRVQMANLDRQDSCGLPRHSQLRPCWKRFAPRFEWMVNYVAVQKGDQRSNVLWNQTDQPLTVSIPKWGELAVAVDKAGNETPLVAQGNRWVVTLARTTRHFDLFGGDPPGYFYVGGDPTIIVEFGVPGNAPVEAPRRS